MNWHLVVESGSTKIKEEHMNYEDTMNSIPHILAFLKVRYPDRIEINHQP